MCELLRKACAEAKEGKFKYNTASTRCWKHIPKQCGNQCLHNSAAAYAQIIIIFVNTSPPGDRVQLLNSMPMDEFEEMENESEEIHSGGLLKL